MTKITTAEVNGKDCMEWYREAQALREALKQAVEILCPWCRLKVPINDEGIHVGPIPERRKKNDRQIVDCRAEFILKVLE